MLAKGTRLHKYSLYVTGLDGFPENYSRLVCFFSSVSLKKALSRFRTMFSAIGASLDSIHDFVGSTLVVVEDSVPVWKGSPSALMALKEYKE